MRQIFHFNVKLPDSGKGVLHHSNNDQGKLDDPLSFFAQKMPWAIYSTILQLLRNIPLAYNNYIT